MAALLKSISPDDPIIIRTAETAEDIEAAQRLRYEIFYEEFGAKPDEDTARTRLDRDVYDDFADHLIVVDRRNPDEEKIIGTYRMLRHDAALQNEGFYSSGEYDLSPLLQSGSNLLELGRSCVLKDYRTRPVLQMLWQGIADYVISHDVDVLFGCASIHGTDIESIQGPLSYLHHYHPAPENLRPRALEERYTNMNILPIDKINPRRAFNDLPPLIKGYLRVGATVGDGAVIDEQFNTTDVLIVMQTHLLTDRYKKHFERKTEKSFSKIDDEELAAKEMEAVVRSNSE